MRVSIKCYGKNLERGGTVELHIGKLYSNYIDIAISHSNWTYYRCKEFIVCPADSTLSICLNSGGIVASAMLIDMLEIIAVN
jgi:hypothetical protein